MIYNPGEPLSFFKTKFDKTRENHSPVMERDRRSGPPWNWRLTTEGSMPMEKLWAPWRMAYIEVSQPEGCIFCTKPAQGDDREQLILYRGQRAFIIMNLFPYNSGHLMVAPYRHTADLVGLSEDEQREMMVLTRYCVRLVGEAFQPEGCNLGMNLGRSAGAGVADHLHMHVVPRWNGDTNFMPVIAETKVLPDALFAGYEKLMAVVRRIKPG
jgi:ATP adenylyltransferase